MTDSCSKQQHALKLDQPGYIANDGTIYLGIVPTYNDETKLYNLKTYVYTMPTDMFESKTTYQKAAEWLANANDTLVHGHSDWDFPTGGTNSYNELLLILEALLYADNSIFNIKIDHYGGKSVQSYTESNRKIYEGIRLCKGMYYGFHEYEKTYFRAVRRTNTLIP